MARACQRVWRWTSKGFRICALLSGRCLRTVGRVATARGCCVLLALWFGGAPGRGWSQEEPRTLVGNPFPHRVPAPSLEGGKEWLNTRGPISLKELRGKIVVLDFWTYCCINCMHILPDLKYIERKFPREVVVIGVHSAKFDNEKESGNIRRAIQRYHIEHPVVNDVEMTIWHKYDVHTWPTLVLIDPEGQVCAIGSGEGQRAGLEQAIERLVTYHRAKGTLDLSPLHFDLERHKLANTPLQFPGKVLADIPGRRLFIADSNHHRIVIASLEGTLQETVGSGALGRKNGDYRQASFDHPQGMALIGEKLYVADTENHLIREVDLAKKQVRTCAGTGRQSRFRSRGGAAGATDLNSPWDLAAVGKKLYIAMAGPHQIWVLDLASETVTRFAGSGAEDVRNGGLADAAFAQPSGLVADDDSLYVVDSEGSAVRKISLEAGDVTTLAGTADLPRGRSLFEFGDRDGVGAEARLQHPLGIALFQRSLVIADSYNHKLKRLDLATGRVTTVAGDARAGDRLDPVRFSEPAGVAIVGHLAIVADTNNHRLVQVELVTGTARLFPIAGLSPPAPMAEESGPRFAVPVQTVPTTHTAAGLPFSVRIKLLVPAGCKLNPLFPISYRVTSPGKLAVTPASFLNRRQRLTLEEESDVVTISLPTVAETTPGQVQLSLDYGYCRAGTSGFCMLHSSAWLLPVELTKSGRAATVSLTTSVPPTFSAVPR